MARPLRLLPVALAAALAGCGGGTSGTGNADPARIAPRSTAVYLVVNLHPDERRRAAVKDFTARVLRTPDPAAAVRELIGEAVAGDSSGVDPELLPDRIEPWLGRRAALAIFPGETAEQSRTAAILAITDVTRAREALDDDGGSAARSLRHRDVPYARFRAQGAGTGSVTFVRGLVGDHLVLAEESSFHRVVDAWRGQGLTAVPEFGRAATGSEDKLAFAYFAADRERPATESPRRLPPIGLRALRGLQAAASPAPGPVAATLDAAPGALSLEFVQRGVRPIPGTLRPTPLVTALPGDSWFAAGAPEVGRTIRGIAQLGGAAEAQVFAFTEELRAQTGVDLQRDVAPALGDVAVFARGSTPISLGAGAVVELADPAAGRRLLSRLAATVERRGRRSGLRVSPTEIAGASGYRVTSERRPPAFPAAINAVLDADRMVVAYGDPATRAALGPARRLGDAPDFRAARRSLGGLQPTTYVAFAPLSTLVAGLGDAEASEVAASLRALRTLAVGDEMVGETRVQRFVLTLR